MAAPHERPGNRCALLLATRHRRREVAGKLRDAHILERSHRFAKGVASPNAVELEGQRHVLRDRERVQQVPPLLHVADRPASQLGEVARRQRPEVLTVEHRHAFLRAIESRCDPQQSGLPRTRRTHHDHELTPTHVEVDSVEDRAAMLAVGHALGDGDEPQDRGRDRPIRGRPAAQRLTVPIGCPDLCRLGHRRALPRRSVAGRIGALSTACRCWHCWSQRSSPSIWAITASRANSLTMSPSAAAALSLVYR